MSSRRLMNRSLSGDGRYYGGNDFTSQNSRGGCRSYLNSVRPESSNAGYRVSQFKPSRSTLCIVMAQLTEETQPTFESTLKSKAVSEATNVKFICTVSGHPAPDVTWYKDDVQLDRYCGLPKYDILRDGKTHTLHIYNCTLEDAAIYQASAQNTRGIVSCSGVLEVGTMNEYKIHQNYFAKLKQRNENRRREQEEPSRTAKENVPEALRTSSPDRTQRKRRSPMETTPSFGASSSSEEKEELNALGQTSPVEDRLSSPVQVPESARVHVSSDSETIPNVDKGSQGLTYIDDTVHTASTKQTGNYAKKKIKKREEMTEMETRNEKRTSVEKMEVQNTVIQNKVDITADAKQSEKPSMKANKGAPDLKRTQVVQKPTLTPRRPALKVAMATETKVVKDSKQIKSSNNQKGLDRRSPLIKPHSQLQAQNTKHVQNQRVENSPDNKLMDLDDNKTKPAAGPCVRILPHSCGKGDVNTDTGDRNASVHSPRASAGGDIHMESTEPEICGNIPSSEKEVVMELNQPPPLMHEITSRVTDTPPILSSHLLASQGQKERAGDQSMGLTNSSTPFVTEHHKPDLESTQLGIKNSTGHVSHTLQDGQVPTAMNSSMEEDTLTKMSEKDHTDGKLIINKRLDKTIGKIKSVATTLNGTEVNDTGINADKKKECFSANVQGQEKSAVSSKNSVSLVTEFVQIRSHSSMSNPDVVQSQTMNDSSNALIKHTKSFKERDSHVATDSVSKMDIQEQGRSYTAKNENQQSSTSKTSTLADGDKDHNDPVHIDSPTFLSQHPKSYHSNFTIPAIYVTDVDSTSPNTKTENMECSNHVGKSDNVKFCAKTNALNNTNAVSQKANTLDHTDNMDKTTATLESEGLSDAQVDLSLHPQPSLSQENFRKTSEDQCSTESIASDLTGPIGRCMPLCNADKSKKANESDLAETKCPALLVKTDSNLKTKSVSFIKQLKSAALELDMSNQRSSSVMLPASPHKDSEGKDKYRQANSEGKQGESVLFQRNKNVYSVVSPLSPSSDVTIPLTDAQISTTMPTSTRSEHTKTEKAYVEKAKQKDTYLEHTQPITPQPASSLNSVNESSSLDRNSPRLTRRGATADLSKPKGNENVKTKSSDKENQFKVPQVIRKIRPEVFDTTGHLKLWCQFFNIVSDSTMRWFKDDKEIAEINRSAGDETQLCLAIVQMSKRDCGVYRCTITNEYGQDSTEYLLSTETVSSMFLRKELQEVGEEIEITPLIFSKGLADAGCWGSKFYGRVTTEEVQVGSGCAHKTRRLKVIYGLDPVFESGSSCFMKVRSPIAYESREETVLAEKNLQITKQDCRIQNMAREYVKIFATETREIESFGSALEIIPLYFMYRPASTVPYATVEAELKGVYLRYCGLDNTGSLVYNNKSEVAQKCSSFQHWIHQWTNGNVLFSRLEGVDTIFTNIEVVTKSKGYQGFPCEANPNVFEQFPTQHQCNYYCGLLNLKPPKLPEMLQTAKYRGSSSPQTQRKATKSPKVSRRSNAQTST